VLGALIAVAAVGFALYAWYHPSQYTYVQRNDSTFAKLPVYPGGHRAHESNAPVYAGNSALSRVTGYRTTRSYSLQTPLPAEAVVDYFLYALRSCRLLSQGDTDARFQCGTSQVALNVGGTNAADRYELTVDSR
jgi:hypothetical protein